MTSTIFEQLDGTYTQQGDYLLPDLKLPEAENHEIGIWGQRHRKWLKGQHRVLYYNLLTSGKLYAHLADVEERAHTIFDRLVSDLAKKEGVTENLKVTDMLAWVGKMNNIRQKATEVVNAEVIYTI